MVCLFRVFFLVFLRNHLFTKCTRSFDFMRVDVGDEVPVVIEVFFTHRANPRKPVRVDDVL